MTHTIHTLALLIVGAAIGILFTSLLIILRDMKDTKREIDAWLDYEREERRGWKESKTQKERKARASWN